MTPEMYTNFIKAMMFTMTNTQVQKESARLDIIWWILGGILLFVSWWIREQLKKNDKNNSNNFKELKDNITNVKDNVYTMSLTMAVEYLRSDRFERHETENKQSIERIHERIDGIKGAPGRNIKNDQS